MNKLTKMIRSKRAMAIPVTFLLLFTSMLGIISITYYFAVEKINTQNSKFKIVSAKQDMLSFDEKILDTLWQSGSARIIEFGNSGGKLNIQPSSNILTINVSDNRDIASIIYNASIGQVSYELPYSSSPDVGLFLKGDGRTVTKTSGSSITQLSIRNGLEHPEVLLRYRPIVSFTSNFEENKKAITTLRIYIVNLNTSEPVALFGSVPLKIASVSTNFLTTTYDLSYEPKSLLITSILDGVNGQVSIPIHSSDEGSIINIEIVACNVEIQRTVR